MTTSQEILKQLQWRYATKKFDSSKKISAQDWSVLEQSLILSPSSYGLQPWKFLIVQNPEIRKELTPLSWNQTQVADCSHFVVFTTLKTVTETYVADYISRVAEVRGIPAESLKGYNDMMVGDLVKGPRSQVIGNWAQRQSYIAMGFLMETAALLNVDTCAMEGLDPAGYDRILKLEGTGYGTVAAVACGFRHAEDKTQMAKKVRFAPERVVQYL